ncbi:MAG: hypothetical protein KQH53_01160 [Desulfarculaceae bacterium]|nr:hypothetical protein [Desulfarculaceae bacterium]
MEQGATHRLLATDPASAEPGRNEITALLALAGGGEEPEPRQARYWLSAWVAARPEALEQALALLPLAPGPAREAAGQWLFAPELADELPLRARLLAGIEALCRLAAEMPEPWLLEGLAELAVAKEDDFLESLLAWAQGAEWARRVVALLPPDTPLPGAAGPRLWLARMEMGPQRAERIARLADTGWWGSLAGMDREALGLARRLVGDAPDAVGSAPLAWPAGPKGLEVLDQTARLILAEGRAACEVARRVSLELDRVVIVLGNASLGAPPLWALPGPWDQEAAALLAHCALPEPPRERAAELANLRARRLGGPSLIRTLWQARAACVLAGEELAAWQPLLDQAEPWLSGEQREALAQGTLGLSISGPPWERARRQARAALAHCTVLERQCRSALRLVYGLADQGGPPLVLPWADKFAASTAKGGDHAYLAGVVGLLSRLDPPPLMLLIDETMHPGFPSMNLLLAEAAKAEPALGFRGVGAFAGQPEPTDLAQAVLQAAREANLVALRPAPGPHPEATLAAAARGEGGGLPLTPASRDGAAWLLAGTDLAELGDASAPSAPGEPPAWLLSENGFAPLGAWLRHRVAALAGLSPPTGRRWRGYQSACSLG